MPARRQPLPGQVPTARQYNSMVSLMLTRFIAYENASQESARMLRQMGVEPLQGPGADLLRAEVAAEVWHTAAVIVASLVSGKEVTD